VARAGAHLVDLVEPQHRRRRVNRVHHIVERDGQGVDVLAVERGDERAVEPVDDGPCAPVADVLDVLDGVGLRHVGGIGRHHLLEELGAAADVVGEGDEIAEELRRWANRPMVSRFKWLCNVGFAGQQ
jgi:hypothetical protein